MAYLKRDIEKKIVKDLKNEDILIISGPRFIGKTAILKNLAKSVNPAYFINLENRMHVQQLNDSPLNLFKIVPRSNKRVYLFIDEIQYLDEPSFFLQRLQQSYKDKLKIVVSTTDLRDEDFALDQKRYYEIASLSFQEFLRFRKKEELLSFFSYRLESDPFKKQIPVSYRDELDKVFLEYIQYGGYPKVVLTSDVLDKKVLLLEMVNGFLNYEILRLSVRNTTKFYTLFKLLAERVGDFYNLSELAKELDISSPTVENYIQILKQNQYINVLYPFSKNYSKEISKTPKFYFKDLGIRNAILDNFEVISDRWDRENYFENIAFNFLSSKEGIKNFNYWRTQTKKEIDFIVNENLAFAVSFNGGRVNKSKHRTFQKIYPEMKLKFITFKNDIDEAVTVLDL